MILMPQFVFGAKSQLCLLAACDLVHFYQVIGRDLMAANIFWDPVVKNFMEQWKALVDWKEADEPDVPKISKILSIIQWMEVFVDYLHHIIGVQTYLLNMLFVIQLMFQGQYWHWKLAACIQLNMVWLRLT